MAEPTRTVEVSNAHPLADATVTRSTGDGWYVRSETRAPIVHLSSGRLDLLGQVARAGGRVVLTTDALSRVTEPTRLVLRAFRGGWTVRGSDGELRDGWSARRLAAVDDSLDIAGPVGVDDVAVRALRVSDRRAVQLVLSYSVRHRARGELVLGRAVERIAQGLGVDRLGWGSSEPAVRAWDRAALTEFARTRMPSASRIVVAGSGTRALSGLLTVERTSEGVEESFQGLISLGAEPDAAAPLAAVPTLLAEVSADVLVLHALAMRRSGRDDLTHEPVLAAPPVPVALLVGAPAVRGAGIVPARDLPGAVAVGKPRLPAALVTCGDDPVEAMRTFTAALAALARRDVLSGAGLPADVADDLQRLADGVRATGGDPDAS